MDMAVGCSLKYTELSNLTLNQPRATTSTKARQLPGSHSPVAQCARKISARAKVAAAMVAHFTPAYRSTRTNTARGTTPYTSSIQLIDKLRAFLGPLKSGR